VAEISAKYQDEGILRELMTAEQKVFDQREENYLYGISREIFLM